MDQTQGSNYNKYDPQLNEEYENYNNYADTFKNKSDLGIGISTNVFNQNLINYEENNINNAGLQNKEILVNENEDPQNYENYDYQENMEGNMQENNDLMDKGQINEEPIENENLNYENMENLGNMGNLNNIHSNIEIFEDVNNHIEEMLDNNENFNNNDINNLNDKGHENY